MRPARAWRAARDHIRTNVVAYVALFVALSATAYALPGGNTVDSGDVKAGQVKTRNLGRFWVTGSKLALSSAGAETGGVELAGLEPATSWVRSGGAVDRSEPEIRLYA
jgi:hypothetical protein